MTEPKYYFTDNANRKIKAGGFEFLFTPTDTLGGIQRGVYATDSHNEQMALTTIPGISEISAKDYASRTSGLRGFSNPFKDRKKAANVFYHSGDLGDIIYSLPVIRERGGGDLVLGPDNRSGHRTREEFTQARMESIGPLLKVQPYISSVTFASTVPTGAADMNQARSTIAADHAANNRSNLCESWLKHFNVKKTDCLEKWLTVKPLHRAQVVIARSPRYQNSQFDWKRILKEWGSKAVFVGLPAEHAAFVRDVGQIEYHPAKDLLEVAQVIAGSELFIGNQSCPYAIAEGLKATAILEDCPSIPNCYFDRADLTYGNPKELVLKPKRQKEMLVIQGPMDIFSGFGQIIQQIVFGLKDRGHSVGIAPTMITDRVQNDPLPIPKNYTDLIVPPNHSENQIIISMHCGLPHLIKGGEVVMTMWESTRISEDTRVALNKAGRVLIPTTWGATAINCCGVDTPISVVPLGIDTKIYRPKARHKGKSFIFGTAGRVAHGGMRKGIDTVISAFLKAFPSDANVQLQVKCYRDCKIADAGDSRISFVRQFMPDLSDWYAGIDCYVTATHGEGWGLQPHQAMATGRPVIAPRFGGITEFYDDSCGWPVQFELTNADGYYKDRGMWAEANIDNLVEKMRYAYKHRTEGKEKGQYAATRAASFSQEHMLDRFEHALRKAGML